MRFTGHLLAFLLFSSLTFAQSTPTPEAVTTAKLTAPAPSKGKVDEKPLVKIGNVPVPPEKARAINIPKIGPGLTIDGRIDEEAWANAAVFKDFIQTGPGDNV